MNNKEKERTNILRGLLWAFICVPLLTLVVVELIPALSLGQSIIFKSIFTYRFAAVAALFAFKYVYKMIHYYNYVVKKIVKTPETMAELSSFRRKNIAEVLILLGAIVLCASINNCAEMIPCVWNITGRQIASTIHISSMYWVLLQIWTIRYNSDSVYKAAISIKDAIIAYEIEMEEREREREETKKGE